MRPLPSVVSAEARLVPFDSQQGGVMTGPDDSVEEEHVVVLLVDPRLRPELRLGQHLQQRSRDRRLGNELDGVAPEVLHPARLAQGPLDSGGRRR